MEEKEIIEFIKNKYMIENEKDILPIGNHKLERNFVYSFWYENKEYVMKISKFHDKWANEIFVEEILEQLSFIPKITHKGIIGDYYYQTMNKIKGITLYNRWQDYTKKDKIKIVKKIGKVCALIHNIKEYDYYGAWARCDAIYDIIKDREFRDNQIIDKFKFGHLMYDEIIKRGIRKLPEYRQNLKNAKSVITHRDFSFRNIIIDEEMKITGVIDFEHAIPDDPCIDICTMIQTPIFDEIEILESFKEGYSQIREFPQNFINNQKYYYLITGLYLCSKYSSRDTKDVIRGLNLIKDSI